MRPLTDPAALSRRLFLRGTGGGLLVGSLGLSNTVSAQGAAGGGTNAERPPARAVGRVEPERETEMPVEPGRRLGYAVVGLGKFALNQIIPSFGESRHARLVALVSGNRDKARAVASRHGVDEGAIYDYDGFDRIKELRAGAGTAAKTTKYAYDPFDRTASQTTIAASSPPERTYGPIETTSLARCSCTRSSKPS